LVIAKGIITDEELKAQSSEERANYLAVREAGSVSLCVDGSERHTGNIKTMWSLHGDFSFEKPGAVGTEPEHRPADDQRLRYIPDVLSRTKRWT
jgi:hypothetical protein